MPFANVSGDPENDYLANGIAQAVTTRLHRAGLRVIPWETTRRFGDVSNTREVATALKVDAVLSGSFQTAGDRLLVTVSLAEGASGFVSWTDEFEEAFDDIFQVQTRIAQGVATNLGHELTGDAAATLARAESSSLDAYDFYLQGAEYLQDGDRESTGIAFDFFSQAVQLDPKLAEAHVGLGAVYLERYWSGWGGGAGNLGLARASFEAALELAPTDMRARRGLNLIEFYRGRDDSTLQFARDAARANSDDIEALLARAEAYALNGPEDPAGPLLERVRALDPGNQAAAWLFVIMSHRLVRLDDAARYADDYVRRFGDDPFVHVLGGSAREQLSDLAGARDRFDRATSRLMQAPVEPGSATAYDLSALLMAGAFHARQGPTERAQELWRMGLQLTRDALAIDPDSIGMRLYLASFLGLLKDRPAFAREESAALALVEAADVNPWELLYLAGAHAELGDEARALEVLRSQLRRGRLAGRVWLTIAAPSLRGTRELAELEREYSAEVERRRARSAPVS
jgi:TolB-like protein